MSHHRSQTAIKAQPPAQEAGPGCPASGAVARPEEAVVRRTSGGWRVGAEELPDLTCAMVLADLLAGIDVEHADVLEYIARLAFRSVLLGAPEKGLPLFVGEHHYLRKHGPKATYGQR